MLLKNKIQTQNVDNQVITPPPPFITILNKGVKKIFLLFIGLLLFSCSEDKPEVAEKEKKEYPGKLSFIKLKRVVSDGKTITVEQLFKQIKDAKKKGFTLKNIHLEDNAKKFVRITGEKPNFTLELLAIGTFTATIVLEHKDYLDKKIQAEFEVAAQQFTFTKFVRDDSSGTKKITADQLLAQIPNAKTQGYTLKSIAISDASFATVSGTKPNLQITLLKPGTFTANIVLEHTSLFEVKIDKAAFEIKLETFVFNKLVRYFADSKTITAKHLLAQMPNAKTKGYTLKAIVISDTSFATISGTKPNLQITLLKPGTFTANLILENPAYFDTKIERALFEISTGAAPSFTFNKLTRNFNGSKIITAAQIIKQIPNASNNGYTLKSITISDTSFARVSGAKPYLQITILKAGTFTAKIVLEKTGYSDATIAAGVFEISTSATPNFIFNKLTRNFSDSKTITTAQILKQIPNASGSGYTLKSIAISDTSFATVSGTKPNLRITLLKPGTFTARIVLEKKNYNDATLAAGVFEINKGTAPNFTFNKLTRNFNGSKIITAAQIIKQIPNASGSGYTLKSIALSDASFATVSGTKPYLQITILKAGTFTAKIVLEKTGYSDATIAAGAFEINKGTAPNFTFNKLTRNFSGSKIITAAQIIKQIPNASGSGYTLKSIAISDASFATVSGAKPYLQITILKTGTFTAKIVLEKTGYSDATIAAGAFEITKVAAPTNLNFDKLTITYSAGKIISKNELLARIRNINGYTLKSIDQISDVSVASVVSAKPNFEIRIKKPGSFTVRMILEKDSNHKDVEITAAFDIARRIEKFTFTPWIRNSTQGKIISTDQILAQIPTAKSKKYTLKSITIADGSFAKVRGTKPNLNIELLKTGKFTANIVLEHNNYFDVEIKGAKFEFKYVKITFDKQYRHHITGLSPVHKSIQQTTDGGYIVAGYTYGSNNQIDLNDIWVLKLDSSGTKTWEQTYGGSKDDRAYAIQQTTDGGYIVAGYTRSKGAGGYDFWVLKLDSSGAKTWEQTYGGSKDDKAYAIQQTTDGGYIVAGQRDGWDGYIWVLKLDKDGTEIWYKMYNDGGAYAIQQTTDGGYIVAGYKLYQHAYYSSSDCWVLKLNAIGNKTWDKTYKLGLSADIHRKPYSIQQTTDGGYIVAGASYNSDGLYVLKLDSGGTITWQHSGTIKGKECSIQQTTDGGYIIAGPGQSYSVGHSYVSNCLVKLDENGNQIWSRALRIRGSNIHTDFYSVKQTIDGGYILSGESSRVLKLNKNGFL